MSVKLRNPSHHQDVFVYVRGSEVKQWTAAGWVKVGRSEAPPTDPEQNAPSSTTPLAEQVESSDS